MPDLQGFQARFRQGILDQESNPPSGLFDETDVRAQIGWKVYQNNVFHSLIEALGDTFPVTRRLVGEDFFRFAAREYIRAKAPSIPVLLSFGAPFAEFVEKFEPARAHSYLGDVARLEFAWLDAYHAEDVGSVDPASFQALSPEEMMDLTFSLTPSLHLLSSRFPVCSIWQAHQGGDDIPALSLDKGGEQVMIVRFGLDVIVREISTGELAFWAALQDGQPLGRAYETAALEDPEIDLSHILAFGLSHSVFSSITTKK